LFITQGGVDNNMKKGSIIKTRHIKTGEYISYMIVEDKTTKKLRLLCMRTSNIMAYFQGDTIQDIIYYINDALKCEIIEINNNIQIIGA
jgi:hypothetical protein